MYNKLKKKTKKKETHTSPLLFKIQIIFNLIKFIMMLFTKLFFFLMFNESKCTAIDSSFHCA